jgi:hypothetical protein
MVSRRTSCRGSVNATLVLAAAIAKATIAFENAGTRARSARVPTGKVPKGSLT